MDAVAEIKARLPIDQLVAQYCQLKQKGRNFVCLCPFHNDSHPSFLVSPDKGIAYCFVCQTGGDIFSFYQAIEGVDFRQALKDLGEKTGVEVSEKAPAVTKDEKERLRECLEAALRFYQKQLSQSNMAQDYLVRRNVTPELQKKFQPGFAPDSFSDTYQHLLKEGFSRKDIIAAGLGIQKELKDERIYDRFRNRLMFPIHDLQGRIVGFGGRTLGEDDAKYINSSEGPLYRKASVLFGLHHAKEAIREKKQVIMVEGYFDVLACHRVGMQNVVAVSGTALTEEHVQILKRYSESVVLCLDQDRAGQDAAERAFHLCAAADLHVKAVTIAQKDPDEAATADPAALRALLEAGGVSYVEMIIQKLRMVDLGSVDVKRAALARILKLLNSVPTAVERQHYLSAAAAVLGTTETALKEDLERVPTAPPSKISRDPAPIVEQKPGPEIFSRLEIALGLFLFYPHLRHLLTELIEPTEGFAAALYKGIKEAPPAARITAEGLALPEEHRERAAILELYCEHHAFIDWSESLAALEIRKNCGRANQDLLREKQKEIAKKLVEARAAGKTTEEAQLSTQYQQVLKLAKMASS